MKYTSLERIGMLALFVVLSLYFTGCGGYTAPSNSTGNPAISVAISTAPPATLGAGKTASIAATVTYDTANGGVDWSCAPASSCGSFSPAHTASGGSTTYTAPGAAGTVTITATSTTAHGATAVATVTVSAATSPTTIAISKAPPASLVLNATSTLSATVTGDSTNAGVDWSCTPVGACGSFNPAHTASAASTTYTAPGAATAVVITAKATASGTTTATANVNITAPISTISNTTLAAGTYVFQVTGETAAKGTYTVAGSVNLDANGNVTGGKQDYISMVAVSPQPSGDTITGGKFTAGAKGVGTLTVITNNATLGAAGTETFSIAVVNSKHGVIGQFDAAATSTGTIDQQSLAPGAISGGFAFVVSGEFGGKSENFGGLINADGVGNLHVTVDINAGGAISRGGSNVGTYTAADAAGRGTMVFGGDSFVYYVVNPKVLRLLVVTLGEPDSGSAYAQPASPTFTNASFGTNKFVFTDASTFANGAFFAAAGQLTTDGNGNISSGFADVVENGTHTAAAFTGTYTVNGAGYGTITITPGNTQDIGSMGLYLVDPTINFADPNSPTAAGVFGLVMDLDTKVTGNGLLILPAATTPAYTFTGNYAIGVQAATAAGELDSVGVLAVAGTAVTGTENVNDLFATGLGPNTAFSGTLVPDAGHAARFTIPVAATIGGHANTANYVLYQTSSSQVVVLETDGAEFALGTLQQQK